MLNSFLPERVGTQSEEHAPVHATRRGRGGERRKRERGKPNVGVRWGEGWTARARHERCYKLEKGSREKEMSI